MSKSIIKQKRILTKAGGGSSLSTPVSVANGGTGLTSYAIGDIIYASGATTLSKLPIGTASQQLRVNAGATALEYFTPTSSGITVGTTTITSGTDTRVPFNDGGVYGEDDDFTWDKTNKRLTIGVTGGEIYNDGLLLIKQTPSTTASLQIGWASVIGTASVAVGPGANASASSVAVGYLATTIGSAGSVAIGSNSTASGGISIAIGGGATAAESSVSIGGTGTGTNATAIGYGTVTNSNLSIAIGRGTKTTAINQLVIGANTAGVTEISSVYIGSGVTDGAPKSVTYNATGGAGTNIAGANITIAGGKGTGSATTGGDIIFQTSDAAASSSTLQTLTTKYTIKKNGVQDYPTTVTAGGTTGDQTINKVSGTVNFAAGATAITVTNSLVSTTSIVFVVVRTNDTTATIKNVVSGSGSFVITLTAAATAETSVGFFTINS